MRSLSASIFAVSAPNRFQQLRTIETDAVLEHEDDVLNVTDLYCGVAADDEEIRVLSRRDGADPVFKAKIGRPVEGGGPIASIGEKPASTRSSFREDRQSRG